MTTAMFFPNSFGHHHLNAIDEVIGVSGTNALLNMAGVTERPPDNLAREFHVEAYAAVNAAFPKMAGKRLGSGLANRSGRASFYHILKNTDFITATRSELRAMTGSEGVARLLQPLTLFSDEAIVDIADGEGSFLVTLRLCPACRGLTSESIADPTQPVCHGIVGWLAEGIRWATGEEVLVEETVCCATEDADHCVFRVDKEAKPDAVSDT